MSSIVMRWRLCAGALALLFALGVPLSAPRAQPVPVDAVAKAGEDVITAKQVAAMQVPVGSIAPSEPAPIKVLNRTVATLRASLMGWSAKTRAEVAEARINDMLAKPGNKQVSLLDRPEGTALLVNDVLMVALLIQDTQAGTAEDTKLEAHKAMAVLQQVIDESRESHDTRAMTISAGVAVALTVALAVLMTLVLRGRRRVQAWLERKTHEQSKQWQGGIELLSSQRLVAIERVALNVVFWLLAALLFYQWLGLTLAQFPYTRVWAEQLNGFLFGLLARFALAIVRAIPDLFAAVLIFALAYAANKALKRFFRAAQFGLVRVSWLDPDVAPVTSRLCSVAIWIFALAMAYPYLPGSDTDAFKGLSVLLGLMISLGASNLVGQAASGLILTYTRTYRVGEYVRVADHEGTVTRLGAFTTRIRTGLGEELTISNSMVLTAVTKNYSRVTKGAGFVVDTVVTIGYDTPWRQVEALLVAAASRTPGVLEEPKPHVFQTALSDFYAEYRLVCQAVPSEPRPRAEIMNQLHANIQDVFNEHGVQIMSPHYQLDPAQPKVVPPDQWYPAPAKPAPEPPPK